MKMKYLLIAAAITALIFAVLKIYPWKSYTAEQKVYIASVEKERAEKDNYMKNDPDSPFNQDERADFKPLKYFDVNPGFVFKSRLHEYETKDSLIIFGTKGEERQTVKYGYLLFNYSDKDYRINVYKSMSRSGVEYYGIWFTDKTTGDDTYGVGRYLDFELNNDKDYVYTIDFNKAYNPYCAYSAKFSCAIPTREDYLDVSMEAGEKNFH